MCRMSLRCYTLNYADPIFERIFRDEKGFDIVANFSAHKHVRSEKDRYSVQALIEKLEGIFAKVDLTKAQVVKLSRCSSRNSSTKKKVRI